jgi:hypothetical protein
MTSPLIYLTEGMRIFFSSQRLKKKGISPYHGNAQDICEQIVADCWNEQYFQTSTTHFAQFWTRDFGWCVASLLKLEHKEKVEKTLLYALDAFSSHGAVTTTITPKGKPFDFPKPAVDSLPWLMHSLALLKDTGIADQFRSFIEKEVERFVLRFVNMSTGLVKKGDFSSIKDFSIRDRSCYDTCMIGSLSISLDTLGFVNPFSDFDYGKLLVDHYWNGVYFYDDLSKKNFVGADAQIFPFYLGIVDDKEMMQSALSAVREAGLDNPLPVAYAGTSASVRMRWQEIFMKGYERGSLWTHMGPLYISLVSQLDSGRARAYVEQYASTIETYKNYMEVFGSDGRPFRTFYYHADQGMLWAANYLTL